MTVNYFSLKMTEEYFPPEAKATSFTTYTDKVLESYYKCFTTGFETSHSIIDCVQEDDKFRATVDSAAFVISTGSLIKTDKTARVLQITKLADKCELILDNQIGNGLITVCGLGFVPVSMNPETRSFTVKDRRYSKTMRFNLNFRDNLTSAGLKPGQEFVSLTVDNKTWWLIPQAGTANPSLDISNSATYMAFKSFVSDGSFLWFTIKTNGSANNYDGVYNLGYGFCGWMNETVLVLPSDQYGDYGAWAAFMHTLDGAFHDGHPPGGVVQWHGLNITKSTPYVAKPWIMANKINGGDSSWNSIIGNSVVGLGSAYMIMSDYLTFKLPGIQYAPVIGRHSPGQLFGYNDKLIIVGEAFYGNAPRFFSLDEEDWTQ